MEVQFIKQVQHYLLKLNCIRSSIKKAL